MNAAYAALVTGVVSSQNAGDVHGVRGPLVVERPRLGRRAHGERPARHVHLGGQRRRVGGRGRRRGSGQHRGPRPQLVGGEHGLVVLHLVLRDHPEREPGAETGAELCAGAEAAGLPPGGQLDLLDQVEHPCADLVAVAARLGRGEQRQGRPLGARVLERVVQRVDLRVHGVAAADRAEQPELLLVGDVRQVPHER